MTDRQLVCKCGNSVADLLGRIDAFEGNLERIKFGAHILKAYEESVNYVYGGITNVEAFCNIDMREEQQRSMGAFNKISEMTATKNSTMFDIRRGEVLGDLSKIRFGVKEKIRQCSR